MTFRDRLCDECKTNGENVYKVCSDCGLTICIYCLSRSSWIVKELPPDCPQCNSEKFLIVDQSPPFLIP
jgi:hypothetical protein